MSRAADDSDPVELRFQPSDAVSSNAREGSMQRRTISNAPGANKAAQSGVQANVAREGPSGRTAVDDHTGEPPNSPISDTDEGPVSTDGATSASHGPRQPGAPSDAAGPSGSSPSAGSSEGGGDCGTDPRVQEPVVTLRRERLHGDGRQTLTYQVRNGGVRVGDFIVTKCGGIITGLRFKEVSNHAASAEPDASFPDVAGNAEQRGGQTSTSTSS